MSHAAVHHLVQKILPVLILLASQETSARASETVPDLHLLKVCGTLGTVAKDANARLEDIRYVDLSAASACQVKDP